MKHREGTSFIQDVRFWKKFVLSLCLVVLVVDKRVNVSLYVGNYIDEILCDVVPMEACHILLGRPWQFDKKTMHNGLTSEITFIHKENNFLLYPLTPSQVVKDQVQMKQKRKNERKK